MDSIAMSEKLMKLGWWREARDVLRRPDVSEADRFLQDCTLVCRMECAEWLAGQEFVGQIPGRIKTQMLKLFDAYTVDWTLNYYTGEGSVIWRTENEKGSGLTD